MVTQQKVRRFLAVCVVVALAGLTGVVPELEAQEGSVTGRVTSETGQPLTGAEVFIRTLNLGTTTDAQGRYRLTEVPPGEHALRVRYLGYSPETRRIRVEAGGEARVDFSLTVSAIGLEELVVTATGERVLEGIGHSVGVVDASEIVDVAPVRDFSDLLVGRAQGVSVRIATGTIGAGTHIRVRGSSSMSGLNQPVVYVDGARLNSDPANLTVSVGGQSTGALNINPEDIESIEVLRGASAVTLYGTEAANGIIRIRTKSGSEADQGGTRVRLWLEGGLHTEPNDYPANWEAVAADGSPCPLTSVAAGTCAQAGMDSFNLMKDERTSPFSTGERWQAGGSAQGRVERLFYYASGEYESSQGVYGSNNELQDVNLRGNFGGSLSEKVDFSVSTGYLTRDLTLPQNDNNLTGILANGLLGGASEDGFFLFSFDDIAKIETTQDREQFVGSANLQWRPNSWITASVNGGMDVSHNKDQQLYPIGAINLGRLGLGARSSNNVRARDYTGEAFVQGEVPLSDELHSQFTVGSQFFVRQRETVLSDAEELVPGTNSLSAAAVTTASESRTEVRTVGFFGQQHLSWRDRLYATAGLRVDRNSAFGADLGFVAYPSVNASWVLSREPWFRPGDWLGELRLRAAFGQAGNQPGTTDAVPFFRPVPATDPTGRDATGVTFENANVGNRDLKPERTTELEIGFEASAFRDRLSTSWTFYHSETTDVLVEQELAPSLGVSERRFVNLAKVRNRGIEGEVNLTHRGGRLGGSLSLGVSANFNTLLDLGEDVSPIQVQEITVHREGFALAGFWDRPFSFTDDDGDGIIAPSELTVGDTVVFLGDPYPVELTASPVIWFGDLVELRTQWLAQLGHQNFAETESLRCLLGTSQFRHDPGTPLEKQAGCLATAFGFSEQGFVQDADFLRLQEASLSFQAPDSWARRLFGAESLSLTLSGRNLGLWTGFEGLDPQTNGTSGTFVTGEELTQPPIRFWSAKVRIAF